MTPLTVGLRVAVPLASFRSPHAREYMETLPCPPPATVYGMLLSLVGETSRLRHEGAELAIGFLRLPERSVVLRWCWRIKDRKAGLGSHVNRRPDFHEVLTGIELALWVREGTDEREPPSLAFRIWRALAHPEHVDRFGALCLGESTHLVDEVAILPHDFRQRGWRLVGDPGGDHTLPIWVDHVGSRGTHWARYRLEESVLEPEPSPEMWTPIRRGGPPGRE